MAKFIEVFRHQQVYIADAIIEALKKEEIPCYLQQGSITGIQLSPVFPVAAPGVEYLVFVAQENSDKAKAIIDNLPFKQEEQKIHWVVDDNPKRQMRLLYYWILVLGIPFILYLIYTLIHVFR